MPWLCSLILFSGTCLWQIFNKLSISGKKNKIGQKIFLIVSQAIEKINIILPVNVAMAAADMYFSFDIFPKGNNSIFILKNWVNFPIKYINAAAFDLSSGAWEYKCTYRFFSSLLNWLIGQTTLFKKGPIWNMISKHFLFVQS